MDPFQKTMDPLKDLPQTCTDTIIALLNYDDLQAMKLVSKSWNEITIKSMRRAHIQERHDYTKAFAIVEELNRGDHVVNHWQVVDTSEGSNQRLCMIYSGLTAFVFDSKTRTFVKVIQTELFYIWKIFYIGDDFFVLVHKKGGPRLINGNGKILLQIKRKILPSDKLEPFDITGSPPLVLCNVLDAQQIGKQIFAVSNPGKAWNFSADEIDNFINQWEANIGNLLAAWEDHFSNGEGLSPVSLAELYGKPDFLRVCEAADIDAVYINLMKEKMSEGNPLGQHELIQLQIINGLSKQLEAQFMLTTEVEDLQLMRRNSIGKNYVIYRTRRVQEDAFASWNLWHFTTNTPVTSLDFLDRSHHTECLGEITTGSGVRCLLFYYTQPVFRGWLRPDHPGCYYSLVNVNDGTVVKQGILLDHSGLDHEKAFITIGNFFFTFPLKVVCGQLGLSKAIFKDNEDPCLKETRMCNLPACPEGRTAKRIRVSASRFRDFIIVVATWLDAGYCEVGKKMIVLSPGAKVMAVKNLPLAEGHQVVDTQL